MRGVLLARSRAVWLCAFLGALALAGCGTSTATNASATISGSTLTVYAGQPPGGSGGQAAADVLSAERLALQQAGAKVGRYTIKLIRLDGSELSDNARTAIQDKSTIAYLGELAPGTSQVSVQILNQQGVLEISPADTAAYLTQSTAAVPGGVSQYYPASSTYHRTFARVVPNSAKEAKAQVQEMRSLGVSKLYVANDGHPYGEAIALEVAQAAHSAGLSASQGAATAAAVRASGASALFYGASADSPADRRRAAARLDAVTAAQPTVKLFAPSGLYDASFVAGLSAAAQGQLYVSSPGFLAQDLTPAAKRFRSAFTTAYGHAPAPLAIFGYEAMDALLAVLGKAGAAANSRAVVVSAFEALANRSSLLGTYSISGGDTSLAPFIFARPRGGQLTPLQFVSLP